MTVDDSQPGRLPGSALILGAGLMGTQIGIEYALAGVRTSLCGRDTEAVRDRLRAAARVAAEAGREVSAELVDELAVFSDPADAGPCDVVVESLPEDLRIKVDLLRRALEVSDEPLVLTNTSSLRIDEIAGHLGLEGRLVGTHYWNPPLLMPLVELVEPTGAEPSLMDHVELLLVALGKRPVRVKDAPGFAWNRLQFSLLREAAALTRAGIISPSDLDLVVREGLALRWSLVGPFESMTLGGLETFERIADNLYPILSTDRAAGDLTSNSYLGAEERSVRREARDTLLARRLRHNPHER